MATESEKLALLHDRTAPLPGAGEPAGTGHRAEALRHVRPACLHTPLFLGMGLLGTAATGVLGLIEGEPVFALLGGTSMAALLAGWWKFRQQVVRPIQAINGWANQILGGNPESRIPVPEQGPLKDLVASINRISDQFQSLTLDMESQVRQQTRHLKHKTRSLEILYDVAASINSSRDLEDLLTRFLHTLKEVVHARAATVRLLGDDGRMRLVASLGLSEEIVEKEQTLPSDRCLCGKALDEGTIQSHASLRVCDRLVGTQFFDHEEIEMIAVPLQYRGRTLGVYNLFIDRQHVSSYEKDKDLLISIGRHLGMAIEKAAVDEEANRLSIIEERTRIAHELHDSLAQTLASLRFQVRVLDETLHQGDESALWTELERIENSLDEAYAELRGLIDHFRTPMDRRGLIPAIEKLVERFRNESNIHIFLQQQWDNTNLPEEQAIQVLRIVQEALNNVRKHSKAHTVRILMRQTDDGRYSVLIEDDGVGIPENREGEALGEHVGLSIMEERARRLGGELHIESEPGEGTRIQLVFTPQKTETPPLLPEVQLPFPHRVRSKWG